MFRIEMNRQDTQNPDKPKRHPSRVSCEVAGRRLEAEGPAPIYRLSTLLWIYGHGGAEFEVCDDVSPSGKPGGLAMHGRVRNWARFSGKGPTFDRRAAREPGFTQLETVAVAASAGKVTSPGQKAGGRGGEAHAAPVSAPDGPDLPGSL